MDTREEIRSVLHEFLRTSLRIDVSGLADSDPLFSIGRLDSLGLLELVAFLEHRYGIAVSPTQLTLEHFDSIEAISAFVRAHSNSE